MFENRTRTSPAPMRKLALFGSALLLATALGASPGHAGGMMGGEGGGGYGGGYSGGGYGGETYGGGRWEPRRQGRSVYGGGWRNCHRFDAASRAAFRAGDYARGNALQDRFYDCMRSRWID